LVWAFCHHDSSLRFSVRADSECVRRRL
jgi:hypothetical protein